MNAQLYFGLMLALSGTPPASASVHVDALRQYAFQAAPGLYANYSGHGLILKACMERLAALDAVLRDRGYRPRRDMQFQDGMHVTRWYHPDTRTAVVAWMDGRNEAVHDLDVAELAWNRQWNELPMP